MRQHATTFPTGFVQKLLPGVVSVAFISLLSVFMFI